MQVFNADNLSFIMLGFAKTIEISFFAIIFSIIFGTVLAMVKQYCTGKLRPLSLLVSAYIELLWPRLSVADLTRFLKASLRLRSRRVLGSSRPCA